MQHVPNERRAVVRARRSPDWRNITPQIQHYHASRRDGVQLHLHMQCVPSIKAAKDIKSYLCRRIPFSAHEKPPLQDPHGLLVCLKHDIVAAGSAVVQVANVVADRVHLIVCKLH